MAKRKVTTIGISDNLVPVVHKDVNSQLVTSRRRLEGIKIGISISESEDLQELGMSNIHLQDMMVECARYLLVQGAHLAYGGDLRANSYTFIFSELAYQYRLKNEQDTNYITNYFSFPIYLQLTKTHVSHFKKHRVNIVKVEPTKSIVKNKNVYIKPDSLENSVSWAKSLSLMRQQMDTDTNARIIMGGRMSKYLGKMPGVLEEALLAIKSKKPLYLVGAFGGVARCMINCFQKSTQLEFVNLLESTSGESAKLLRYFNKKQSKKKIDYKEIYQTMNRYGVDKLSKYNGLSKEENQRLFESTQIPEIVFLILKGLNNIKFPKNN